MVIIRLKLLLTLLLIQTLDSLTSRINLFTLILRIVWSKFFFFIKRLIHNLFVFIKITVDFGKFYFLADARIDIEEFFWKRFSTLRRISDVDLDDVRPSGFYKLCRFILFFIALKYSINCYFYLSFIF